MRVMTHFARWLIGIDQPESQTNERERQCLARHAAGKKKLVEIGVWEGMTTMRLRAAMAADAELLCVDPYPVGRLGFSTQRIIARRSVGKIRNGRVRWVRATGADAGRRYRIDTEGPVDFIFIDGDHTYEALKGDWEAWSGWVAPDGIVALHDSRSSAERQIDDAGSARFTRHVILNDRRFREIEAVDTLTVVGRAGPGS